MIYPHAERILSPDVLEITAVRFAGADPCGMNAFETAASDIEQRMFDWLEEIDGSPGSGVPEPAPLRIWPNQPVLPHAQGSSRARSG